MAVDENGDGVIVFAEFLVAMQTLAEQFELHNEGGDAAILAVKLSNGWPYLYGITIEKLIDWMKNPPAATVEVKEMTTAA